MKTNMKEALTIAKNIVMAPVLIPTYMIEKKILGALDNHEAKKQCEEIVRFLKENDYDYAAFCTEEDKA